jgi:glycosyltransferase involved in cell wall biosynthesis
MPPITATIVAHNEERRIGKAIESLGCADEIILIDDGSTDRTREIAESLGALVFIHQPWPGPAAQKNLAASRARHDWILSLDADEVLSDEARAAVEAWKRQEPRAAGYRFARQQFFMGRWIRHSGWYPDYKLRLYDRRRGGFGGGPVHDAVRVEGAVETLAGKILHYPVETLEEYYRQLDSYSERMARDLAARGVRVTWGDRWIAPAWRFVHAYLVHLGFLDGRAGWVIARAEARYVWRKYARAAELLAARARDTAAR